MINPHKTDNIKLFNKNFITQRNLNLLYPYINGICVLITDSSNYNTSLCEVTEVNDHYRGLIHPTNQYKWKRLLFSFCSGTNIDSYISACWSNGYGSVVSIERLLSSFLVNLESNQESNHIFELVSSRLKNITPSTDTPLLSYMVMASSMGAGIKNTECIHDKTLFSMIYLFAESLIIIKNALDIHNERNVNNKSPINCFITKLNTDLSFKLHILRMYNSISKNFYDTDFKEIKNNLMSLANYMWGFIVNYAKSNNIVIVNENLV